jgi:DNA-binding NarL/FixJ family response regulator
MTDYSFLIADDHWLVRQGIRHTLSELGDEVTITEAASYADVLSLLRNNAKFDLLLLDLSMPGMSYDEGLEEIRQIAPSVPLVVVSGADDPITIRQLISAGAAGFIPKSEPPKILLSALQLVLSGGIYVPTMALATVTQEETLHLTDRQMQVLKLLAEGAPNKTIANELGLAVPTVKIHVAAVLRQLSARNRTEAVQHAIRQGLIDAP